MEGSGDQGLDEAAIRSWETMNMGDEFEAEAGSEQVVARFGQDSPNTVIKALPFASLGWRDGDSTIRYRLTTFTPALQAVDESEPAFWLPALSVRNGDLVMEHGLHQEIGWERQTDASGMTVLVYADNVDSPAIEAAGRFGGAGAALMAGKMLLDRSSGLLRVTGPDFSTAGLLATFEHRLPGGNRVRLSYANGDALVTPASPYPAQLAQLIAGTHSRRVQTYALALSGTVDGTGTRWRASYRWQPADTVTQVAPFAVDAMEPYFNLRLRQPICQHREGSGGIEALLDVRNMLAEGYRPYLLNDGSLLVFAQEQRSIRGGLAFTF
jgi:hypothetical protein